MWIRPPSSEAVRCVPCAASTVVFVTSLPVFEALRWEEERALGVRVSASTSNLGPGFDLLGLALSMELHVTARSDAGRSRAGLGPGLEAEAWPLGDDNLLLVAFERALRRFGGSPRGMALEVRSEIPLSRGLGSSASAIVAGLLLGAAVAPAPASREELLGLALELEGHPDNVAPALLGGCVLAVPSGREVRVVRQALHASLAFCVAWPRAQLATSFARRLLPAEVRFADAVENPRRLALLLEELRSGDPQLLALGGEDRLHVPYRLPHIPGGREALAAARGAGAWLATISGSGSALIAIASHERAPEVASSMAAAFDAAGAHGQGRVVRPSFEPPQPHLLD